MNAERFNNVRLLVPGRGVCPTCAAAHRADMPHDADSFYYIAVFRRRHGRLPTWEDAMAHCPEPVKTRTRQALKARGIESGGDGSNGAWVD